MDYKFKVGVDVTILGTDLQMGFVEHRLYHSSAPNAPWYAVVLDNPDAVYPYTDTVRIYPEWMLESIGE